MLKTYVSKIFQTGQRGDATEISYYSDLSNLIRDYAESVGKKKIEVTTIPKKTEGGNPDFRVWDGKEKIVGYIEAKAPSVTHLDEIETTEQLKRYLGIFPNLILTNFHEFRLYRDGAEIDRVLISRPLIARKLKVVPVVEKEKEFFQLLEKFFAFVFPAITDAKTLAIELAKRTGFLRDQVISEELKAEKGQLHGFYEAFQKFLISGLTTADFADLYSQTVAYGLFAARTRTENGFNRKLAYDNIPQTIGILREMFQFISWGKLSYDMECSIDDISAVLAATDVKNILHRFFHEGKGKDPIVHFYETFLAEYDPETRERRGVYYTPEPVVSYIVRSLHQILKEEFNRSEGFASTSVTVLDPAAGTLTFLAEAAKLAVEEFVSKYGEGSKEEFIKEHILRDFYAFELMMAPYAVGHLKMGFLLEELGYKLRKDDRFKLYLTNTLEMEALKKTEFPGMVSLSEESREAGRVKKQQPILVILGNPPYSGHSTNVGEWISKEIKAYFQVDGKPLGEKNPKWLQDDYVKFIRFAQWKIDQAGEGVLGFITNHSYLDNPTFRGMRQSLMKSFDEIHILDLHGNSLKKEKCPDGSKDENVFDIQQGVAIALCIKKKRTKDATQVFHSEIWSLREEKYDWLEKNGIKTTRWKDISPKSEFYLFVPRDEKLLEQYEKSPKVTEIFPVNSVGIVTARDNLTIKWTPDETWRTVSSFVKMDPEIARLTYNLGKDVRDWKVELAQKDLKDSNMEKKNVVPILYRPFDMRFTYYTGRSRGFICMPRPEVMRHMLQKNLGLITVRQVAEGVFNHALAADAIMESRMTLSNKGIAFLFPLYLYPDTDKRDLFSHTRTTEKKKPNIKTEILNGLSDGYRKEPTPEEMFHYIYAVLYSNTYRTKYAEFLKIDFPRIPFTKDYGLFRKLGEYGKELVDLYLLRLEGKTIAKFQGKNGNVVGKLKYEEKQRRVYINKDQYFEGIPNEVWEYQIGGYQIAEKWLKDRKGRRLSVDEITKYCRIVTALQRTIEAQKEIDKIYPEAEKEVMTFKK